MRPISTLYRLNEVLLFTQSFLSESGMSKSKRTPAFIEDSDEELEDVSGM